MALVIIGTYRTICKLGSVGPISRYISLYEATLVRGKRVIYAIIT